MSKINPSGRASTPFPVKGYGVSAPGGNGASSYKQCAAPRSYPSKPGDSSLEVGKYGNADKVKSRTHGGSLPKMSDPTPVNGTSPGVKSKQEYKK